MGIGYCKYDRVRGNFSECPKLKDLTPAGYRAFETVLERWSIITAHPMPHKAFEVIKALHPDIAALFSNTPNSLLMSAGGVEYVMNQVKVHSSVRPGDEVKEVMDRVYDVARRKDEALAAFVIRCTQ